jgi:DNA-binding CsgD family transcriptional regulator
MVNRAPDNDDPFESTLDATHPARAERSGIATLTPRQKDCLRLTAEFKGSKEIGIELGVSQKTVDTHIAAAIKTLGASSRRHAARIFSQHCTENASDKLLRQTSRLADLPTTQSHSPLQMDEADASPTGFQEKGHGLSPTPPWNASGQRCRDLLKGVRPDDLSTTHRVAMIVFGAIAIALVLAITVTFVEVLSRLIDQTA